MTCPLLYPLKVKVKPLIPQYILSKEHHAHTMDRTQCVRPARLVVWQRPLHPGTPWQLHSSLSHDDSSGDPRGSCEPGDRGFPPTSPLDSTPGPAPSPVLTVGGGTIRVAVTITRGRGLRMRRVSWQRRWWISSEGNLREGKSSSYVHTDHQCTHILYIR